MHPKCLDGLQEWVKHTERRKTVLSILVQPHVHPTLDLLPVWTITTFSVMGCKFK